MKKSFLLLITFISLLSCSKSDNAADPVPSTSPFFSAHVGKWKTTFTAQNINQVLSISTTNMLVYTKAISASCYNLYQPQAVGTIQVLEDSAQRLSVYNSNVPASSVFSPSDVAILNANGYTTVSISTVFLHTSSDVISYGSVTYAGNSTIELVTISANYGSISSFVNCKMSGKNETTKFVLSEKAKLLLKANKQ
jgi:hypothetical protein